MTIQLSDMIGSSMITKRANEAQKPPDKVMAFDEVKAMMIQTEKDSALTSLLDVSRKLGEVEGVIIHSGRPRQGPGGRTTGLRTITQ